MKMRAFTLLGGLGVLMLSGIASTQTPTVEERMAWFKDAKVGMFIHFGVHTKVTLIRILMPASGRVLPRPVGCNMSF